MVFSGFKIIFLLALVTLFFSSQTLCIFCLIYLSLWHLGMVLRNVKHCPVCVFRNSGAFKTILQHQTLSENIYRSPIIFLCPISLIPTNFHVPTRDKELGYGRQLVHRKQSSFSGLFDTGRSWISSRAAKSAVDKPVFIFLQYNVSSGTERLLGSCQRAPQRQPDHLPAMQIR